MKYSIVDRVYEIVNHFMHGSAHPSRTCPVTGLDISMQPVNSKFLSFTGVKWYFEHNRRIYNNILYSRLTDHYKDADIYTQFREIAHSIRNSDSNPRNNSRRAIQKVLSEKDCLFNNLELIDRDKLKKAGL